MAPNEMINHTLTFEEQWHVLKNSVIDGQLAYKIRSNTWNIDISPTGRNKTISIPPFDLAWLSQNRIRLFAVPNTNVKIVNHTRFSCAHDLNILSLTGPNFLILGVTTNIGSIEPGKNNSGNVVFQEPIKRDNPTTLKVGKLAPRTYLHIEGYVESTNIGSTDQALLTLDGQNNAALESARDSSFSLKKSKLVVSKTLGKNYFDLGKKSRVLIQNNDSGSEIYFRFTDEAVAAIDNPQAQIYIDGCNAIFKNPGNSFENLSFSRQHNIVWATGTLLEGRQLELINSGDASKLEFKAAFLPKGYNPTEADKNGIFIFKTNNDFICGQMQSGKAIPLGVGLDIASAVKTAMQSPLFKENNLMRI